MAPEKYVKLRGSDRKVKPGATQTGTLDPNELMAVTLVLRPRALGPKQASLDKVIASGQRLSRDEYESRYGADPADIHKVAAFASANKLAVASVNVASRTVTLSGTAADFAKAFQVQLARYEYEGRPYRGRTGSVSIPEELSGVVRGVHGLDNRAQALAHFRVATAKSATFSAAAVAASTSFTPLQ